MEITLVFFVTLSFLIGLGPASRLFHASKTPSSSALFFASVPLGTILLTLFLTHSYILGLSVQVAFLPITGALVVGSIALSIQQRSILSSCFSYIFNRRSTLIYTVTILATAFILIYPFKFAPANWLSIRANPGDQIVYMSLAEVVRIISYPEWQKLNTQQVAALTPLGINTMQLQSIGPAIGVLLAAFTLPFKLSMLDADHALKLHLSLCVLFAALHCGKVLNFRVMRNIGVSFIIAVGFWATYIRDMNAYTQLLQTSTSLLLLAFVLRITCLPQDDDKTSRTPSKFNTLHVANGLGLLLAATLVFYKEVFLAIVAPTTLLLIAFLITQNRPRPRSVIQFGLIIITFLLFWAWPNLLHFNSVLLNNLVSLKIDASWHMEWLKKPSKLSGYWGNSYLETLISHKLGISPKWSIVPGIFLGLGFIGLGRRALRNDSIAVALCAPLIVSIGIATVFFLQHDLYRAGKALGYVYFIPLLAIAYMSCQASPMNLSLEKLCRNDFRTFASIGFVYLSTTNALFALDYLLHSRNGKELPRPYVHHSYLFDVVKRADFDFSAFTPTFLSNSESKIILDIKDTYLHLLTFFAYDRLTVGTVNSIVDTDLPQSVFFPSPLPPNANKATFILTDRGISEKYWIGQGFRQVAANRSLVLLEEENADSLASQYRLLFGMAKECVYSNNGLSPATNVLRTLGINGNEVGTYSVIYVYSMMRDPVRLVVQALNEPQPTLKRILINSKALPFKSYSSGNQTTYVSDEFFLSDTKRVTAIELSSENYFRANYIHLAPSINQSLSQLDPPTSFIAIKKCFRLDDRSFIRTMAEPWFGGLPIQLNGFAEVESTQWGHARWTNSKVATLTLPSLPGSVARLQLKVVHTDIGSQRLTIRHNEKVIKQIVMETPGPVTEVISFVPSGDTNRIALEVQNFRESTSGSHARGILVTDLSLIDQ